MAQTDTDISLPEPCSTAKYPRVASRARLAASRLSLAGVWTINRTGQKGGVSGVLAAILMLSAPVPAVAQVSAPPIDGAIEQLKPGEYLWAPEIAPNGPVTLIVSLKAQRAFVYRNGLPIGVSTASTGKEGRETPTGIFTILQKDADHHSNLYDDAPMPFMQRLTWDGIALHAGNVPGYPASHGCIRLPAAFAKLLYGITKLGLTVVITDDAVAPEVSTPPAALEEPARAENLRSARFVWRPDRSPSGPVSIVVSGRDRRIVVLRNGIEIGSAGITVDGDIEQTEAFTLGASADGKVHWLRLKLPNQKAGLRSEMSADERARAHLPAGLREQILGILEPGATLLVTRDSLRSSGTGRQLTVIATDAE